MAQYDFGSIVATSKSGTALAADLNAWRTAVHSAHKGPTAPSYAVAGMAWLDDTTATAWVLKRYDGADWITECTYNPTDNTYSPRWAKGANIASAAALTVPVHGNSFDVTGTTGVTSVNARSGGTIGSIVHLHFTGIQTWTHHATNLILPGAANIVTAVGDDMWLQEYGAGTWRLVGFQKASGLAAARTICFPDLILIPTNKDYRIVQKVNFPGVVNETVTKASGGTCTATFKINSTGLGGGANAATSSEVVVTHSSANAFVAGDDLVITITSAAACTDLSVNFNCTRTD